jgi:LuxR family transcriptional regulator, quorum-sensing system regulator LasR
MRDMPHDYSAEWGSMHMTTVNGLLEQLINGGGHRSLDAWRDQLFQFGANQGYRYAMLAIFQSHDTPIELRNAYLHTNLPDAYVREYDGRRYGEIDPIVLHCIARSTPLAWSSGVFVGERQVELYREMHRRGLHSGIVLPYHGPCAEFGFLSFGGDEAMPRPDVAELAYFRDLAMEVFSGFQRKGYAVKHQDIEITSRELECLKWCAAGKSSWDIAQLMNCTEATVNFHFANIRRKFGASSRRMAVIKAIQLGFLSV